MYNTAVKSELFADVRHTGPIWSVALSPDGKRIATGSEDKTAQIWDADTGARLGPSFEHTGTVWTVAFTPDGESLVTSCLDRAQVWDISTGKPLGPPLRHGGVVWAAALSPNGKTFLTGSTLGTARLWTMPDPWTDVISQVVRRVQFLTGLELNERGAIQVLSGEAWRERSATFSFSAGPVKAAEAARSEQ